MGGIFLNLKTRDEIKNEYWMKFLKSGRIEDYIMYNKYNKDDNIELAELGVLNDNSEQRKNRRDCNQN